jgi:predicted Zn-dependent protease
MIKNITLLFIIPLLLGGCSMFKIGNKSDVPSGGFNLFTIEQDKELGAQVAGELASDPEKYPVLDSASNVAAYKYIYDMRNTILNTGKVEHKDDFLWQIRIIEDDSTLNAFCTPGGYIYVYTGIIKYLDNEHELAGVMGHEMGHADLRHSTRQMTKINGLQMLINATLGDRESIKQITTGLIGLKFSRSHETEADRISVEYLCGSQYNADGGAGFFEKIAAQGGGNQPEFMSTHPSPSNRINNYHAWASESNCVNTGGQSSMTYDEFKRLF